MENHSLVWLRRDLRLADNTALNNALQESKKVSLIFIFDEHIINGLPKSDRRISFIWESLEDMNVQLAKKSAEQIAIVFGKPEEIIPRILLRTSITALYLNHDYEPYGIERDSKIEKFCRRNHMSFHAFKDQVMFDKSEIIKDDGIPYKVFTAYKNKWLFELEKSPPDSAATKAFDWKKVERLNIGDKSVNSLTDLGFDSQTNVLTGGETSALRAWKAFQNNSLADYYRVRDLPALNRTSHLSPYLRFGNISIRRLVRYLAPQKSAGARIFLSELIWREFFMMILFHFPHAADRNFNARYDGIPWINSKRWFRAWCAGRTGFPIVDAGMRELNSTGHMHNRVRMIVASFLVKHLHVDWRWGEKYFAEKLLDFELSSNNGNWQWAAGTGVDAAPYFRIFNPLTQSKKFDSDGIYIKKWIPELRGLSSKEIHDPMDAVRSEYPAAMIELAKERQICLQLYGAIKKPR